MAALELLANPDQLQRKLDQFKAAEEKAQELIELAGPADQILTIRSEIDADRTAAAEYLNKANEDAKRIMNDAEDQVRDMIQRAQTQADAIRAEAEQSRVGIAALEQKAGEALADADNAKAEADRLATEAKAFEGMLSKRAATLKALETELLQEKSKLATVREQIATALR